MKMPVALVPALLAAALVGCQTQPVSTQPLDCHAGPDCRVQVSVNCPMAGCSISVDHDEVHARPHGNTKIVWDVQTASYVFDSNQGIVFADPGFDCHVEANGRRYSCIDNADPGKHKYTVNLVGSPAVGPLDPWVVNN